MKKADRAKLRDDARSLLRSGSPAQLHRTAEAAARNLSTEIKRKFWKAMTTGGKSIGEARAIAGIDSVHVAAALVIQCHSTIHIPMSVEDIT